MVVRPQWEWQFEGAAGVVLERPVSPVFTTQFDAEQWLGETWRALAGQGVRAVRLLHEGAQATPTLTLPAA
ncbi:hypothetical protein [Cellulomonas fimi]|uniref:Uncharacterized protein n=1 Tax=Cellulomonas fimi (strain ATCC 484 / DSM 20113 / JCM 1341 / CCUG 24087 / LMG 16345 / NBRC 15513 / NCIMB 8980 / NCTC 7547 / NRS-133) TaxID=590998 RepID=F4H235_CELFA|nr:hypothetical protein [Cellulomonas fimi]AEE46332.1 hypothetical protein Celf_2204 [Cellulomonas fimi ATCC 484]NNH08479.1 hypothetical protein [Cellulomonas fimi]VEH32562.1 Uncharacterised protein [Cellulomonas fimi]